MTRVTDLHPIALDEIRTLADGRFGDMIKGVVDFFALAARRTHVTS